MKVHVDFLISTLGGLAFGNATGTLNVSVAPSVGDSISLIGAKTGKLPGDSLPTDLRIDGEVSGPPLDGATLYLSLEDATVPSRELAEVFAEYLRSELGLLVNEF